MTSSKAVLSVAVLLLASAPLALGQGTYTQIDVPGSTQTQAYGIDTAADVVGYYEDTSGAFHGFLLSGGAYTTIDYPGQSETFLSAINDRGQIVGEYFAGFNGGFLYNIAQQHFTNLAFPNSSGVAPYGINNAGTIVGNIYFNQSGKPPNVGFEFSNGSYQPVIKGGFTASYIRGINNSGEAVGGVFKNGYLRLFLLEQGKLIPLEIHAPNPAPQAINNSGAIVGEYNPTETTEEGFPYQNDVFQPLVFPGSIQTAATGINDLGEVVGQFTDSSSSIHGFTWTPPADAAKK